MLEIFAIILLWKQLGIYLNTKGYERTIWMKLLLVFCWLAGELLDAFSFGLVQAGRGIQADGFSLAAYGFAILGALIGIGIVFGIAAIMPRKGPSVAPI